MEENEDVQILVATHKKYKMPKEKIYLPIQVGKSGKENIGYKTDDEGENISNKNPYYSELTGIYWAWKNLNAKYIGLSHYRRHFSNGNNFKNLLVKDKMKCILTEKKVNELLKTTDVILPKKRNYYIETLYSHYQHTMHIETLDETRKIIEELEPEYLQEFDNKMKKTYAHMFNMFIMKKEIFTSYCKWLFPILEELEKRIPPEKYSKFHARYLGRISELLLDVWINKNDIKYKELAVVNIEKINWIKKGGAFLKAKFVKEKYEESF